MSNYLSGADAPSRSIGTITLSWGSLMNMSLSLYTGTEEVSLGRKEFVEGDTNRPAGRAVIDKSTGEIVDSSTVIRLAEADNGAWIEVTDEEMASIIGVKNVAEVITFVPADEARASYVPSAYMQVRPKKIKGVNDPASAKAFALFLQVLSERGLMALVSLATRGPAKYGLITATGDFLYVYSTDEVRHPVPMSLPPVEADHLVMAGQLVDAIGVSTPRLPNVTAQGLRALVNAKAAGVAPATPAEPAATKEVDLMAALQASIEAKRNQATVWPAPTAPEVKVA
jgi:non-homologous end joining protein Ku